MQRIALFLFLSFFTVHTLQAQDTLKTAPAADTTESITPPDAPPPIELSQVGDSTKTATDTTAIQVTADSTKPTADSVVVVDTAGKVEVTTQSDTKQDQLTGIVFEKDGVTPVPGATVQWVKNPINTLTDADGNFAIERRKEGGLLTISSVGYSTQRIHVQPGQNGLKVTLGLSATTKIDEVVVTALGAQRNTRSLGYSVQQLEGRTIQEAKEVNYINALQGKLAGVQINNASGSMGGSAKVTIRGVKSITGDNNALFIVDGVPMANMNLNNSTQGTGGGGYDYGNPAQLINPNDVDNISVLKGAAATALYGSRGQNGVIYITTKSGKGSGPLTVNYDLNLQISKVSLLPKYQNKYGGGSDGTFSKLYYNDNPGAFGPNGGTYNDNDGKGSYDLLPQYSADESWGPALDGRNVRHYWSWDQNKGNPFFGQSAPWSPNPNNVRDFFQTGVTMSNNVSVSSGNDKGSIRFSLGQTKQNFIYPGSHLDRVFMGLNTNYQFTDRLSFSGSFNYILDKAKGRAGTGFFGTNPMLQFTMYGQRQLDNNRLKDYKYADGTEQSWNRTSWDNPVPVSAQNPYWNQYENYNTDRNDRYYGNAGFSYKITDWLTADARVFSDFLTHIDEVRSAKGLFVGGYTRRDLTYNENNYQATLNVNKSFAHDKLNLEAIAGGNILNIRSSTTTGNANGGLMSPGVYVLQNSVLPATILNAYGNKQVNSLFATATLGYDKLIYLTLTGRNDWASSLKQTGNFSYFYPSAATSFIFSELIPKNKWLTFGKARLSYAMVGNDAAAYSVSRNFDFVAPFGSYPLQTTPDLLFNSKLKPELSREFEGGLDLRFLNDRIGVGITYYNRNTTNQIWSIQLPPESGYSSKIVNGGNVQNKGIELSINATPVIAGAFTWETSLNFSKNKNKVIDLNSNDESISGTEMVIVGTERRTQRVSMVAMKGMPLGTIIGTDYKYDNNGNRIVMPNGQYDVTTKSVVIGDANPDFIGGFSNTFSYKGIYLSALVDFQKGGNFFSYTNLYGNKSGLLEETAADGIRENGVVNPGVQADGTPNTVVISAKDHFNFDGGNRISKANLYDASFIYLREVRLGWNLPDAWLRKTKMQSARLSLVGRNLWLIHSNAPNVDPSNIGNSIGNSMGFEGGGLPPVRSYGINLNINF